MPASTTLARRPRPGLPARRVAIGGLELSPDGMSPVDAGDSTARRARVPAPPARGLNPARPRRSARRRPVPGASGAAWYTGYIHGTLDRRRLSAEPDDAVRRQPRSGRGARHEHPCAAGSSAPTLATSSAARSGTCASRTPTGSASRWRSRTPTTSGCPTSASRPSTGCSTTSTRSCASACSCPRRRSWRAAARSRAPLRTLESRDAGPRVRRPGVLGVVRVGLPERRHPPAPGRPAGLRRGAERASPARRHRRRGHLREPRAAGAVRRRHRGRRGRGAGSRARSPASAPAARDRSCCASWLAGSQGFYVPSLYEVRYGDDGTPSGFAPRRARARRSPVRKAALTTAGASIRPPRRSSRRTPSSDRACSSRSCAAARTCAGSAGPATTTCPCAPSRPTASSRSPPRRAPHATRVGLVSIALCDHPEIERILARLGEMGYLDQPGVAAARRPHRADRAHCSARAASARSRSRPRPAPIGSGA